MYTYILTPFFFLIICISKYFNNLIWRLLSNGCECVIYLRNMYPKSACAPWSSIFPMNPQIYLSNKLTAFITKRKKLQIWLVGDGLSEEEQKKAAKGTIFIPFSQFPPKRTRKDCFYYNTPSMLAPKYLENLDSCEVRTSS